jgi:hypothetical protein
MISVITFVDMIVPPARDYPTTAFADSCIAEICCRYEETLSDAFTVFDPQF